MKRDSYTGIDGTYPVSASEEERLQQELPQLCSPQPTSPTGKTSDERNLVLWDLGIIPLFQVGLSRSNLFRVDYSTDYCKELVYNSWRFLLDLC